MLTPAVGRDFSRRFGAALKSSPSAGQSRALWADRADVVIPASRVRAARVFRRVILWNRAMLESHRRAPRPSTKRAERTKVDSRPRGARRSMCASVNGRLRDGTLARRGEPVMVHYGKPATM